MYDTIPSRILLRPLSVIAWILSGLKWLYVVPVPRTFIRIWALSRWYGWLASSIINLMISDLWIQVAEIILCRSHTHVDLVRKTWLDELNNNTVAAAIVASVAITTLTLDDLNTMHWSIAALWTASLVLSLICIFTSTKLTRKIGMLIRPDDTLNWITVKKDVVLGRTHHPKRHIATGQPQGDNGLVDLPSIAALLLVSTSRWLLTTSVLTFLGGLGGYLFDLWRQNLSTFGSSSEKVFWCLVGLTALTLIWFLHLTIQHAGEQPPQDLRDYLIDSLLDKRQQRLGRTGCRNEEEYRQWQRRGSPHAGVKSTSQSSIDVPLSPGVTGHDLEKQPQPPAPAPDARLQKALNAFVFPDTTRPTIDGEPLTLEEWLRWKRGEVVHGVSGRGHALNFEDLKHHHSVDSQAAP